MSQGTENLSEFSLNCLKQSSAHRIAMNTSPP
ncbi:rCG57566, isoform CRA_a [Rattus norvegicus]|uniref:RCG57566, isoform CRA_a n=1 Tax=Rattus norvegicus TaxID=10116 RepID=A6JHV7_RAT|nr:rCG57566, isoform CRA_a [Rattus norvegicus]